MSRIGKQPVAIPSGVKVAVEKGVVKVEGPKGKLAQPIHPNMKVESDGKQITFQQLMRSVDDSAQVVHKHVKPVSVPLVLALGT